MEESKKKTRLNPSAKSFTFNPSASSWTPRSFASTVPAAPATVPAVAAPISITERDQHSVTTTTSATRTKNDQHSQIPSLGDVSIKSAAGGTGSSKSADGGTVEHITPTPNPLTPQNSMVDVIQRDKNNNTKEMMERVTATLESVELENEKNNGKQVEMIAQSTSGNQPIGTNDTEKQDNEENVEEEDVEEEEEEEEEIIEAVDEDPREHLNLVFIGHVDAGKSTISGNILYLMNQVDKRTIERYEREAKERNRESWFLAFIMDTSEEERAKGKTVEVGRAHFETNIRRYTILDAPGHKSYVPNMIQGASQADVGLLVISARKGEFETGFERGGQTREHALLAKTLGVNRLVVLINKMDEANWDENRYNECITKLKPFLKSCGFAVRRDVFFIPISGLTGENILEKSPKCEKWYDGESLIKFLDTIPITGRKVDGPLRVPILDRYYERGTIALGKVESGILRTGQKVMIMPTRQEVTIQQIFINDNPVHTAKAGEDISFKVSCHLDEIVRGFVISDRENRCPHTRRFLGQLALVDVLEHRPLFTAGYNAMLHLHTLTVECTATKLIALIDTKTGKPIKKKITFIKQGQVAIVKFEVDQSICIDLYDHMPQIGRFTIRDEGKTIGIGKIIKIDDEK